MLTSKILEYFKICNLIFGNQHVYIYTYVRDIKQEALYVVC